MDTSRVLLDGFVGDESQYGGLKLQVMSQREAMNFNPPPNSVCISISSAAHGIRIPQLSSNFDAIHRVEFDDVAFADKLSTDSRDITARQADAIADFVVANKDKKLLVVHCFAGVSRSRSMAAGIAAALQLPYQFTILNEPVFMKIERAVRKKMQDVSDTGGHSR